MRNLSILILVTTAAIGLAGCDRETAKGGTEKPVDQGPIRSGPVNGGALDRTPAAAGEPGNVPSGRQVDNSLTNNNDNGAAEKRNNVPAPGSNSSSSGGASGSDGRGGSGSSLSPAVSGKSAYDQQKK